MQVSVENISELERRMTVQVPAERIDQAVEERLKSLRPRTKIDGFRPGKVPASVVRRMYGESVRSEVVGEVIQSTFAENIEADKLRPAGGPQVDLTKDEAGEALEYSATFEVYPEIELAPVDELEVSRITAVVEDADVDKVVDNMRRQRTDWEGVERAAEDGDQVTMSFVGSLDGEPFDGGTADDFKLVLGSGQMIPGFEDGLVGASAGESRKVDVTFPEVYQNADLASKAAQFAVEVSAVAQPLLPELDDAFFVAFGVNEGGLEGFRDAVKQNMQRELGQAQRNRVKKTVLDALLAANELQIPKVLIDDECGRLAKQMQEHSGAAGAQPLPNDFFTGEATRRVTLGLLLGEVIEASGLQPDADRVRQSVEEFAAGYDNPEEVVKWYYANREQLAKIEMVVLEDQVVDWILERAKVTEEAIGFEAMINPAPASADNEAA